MNEKQLKAKIAYLVQENSQLREALLDSRIMAGQIALAEEASEEDK